MRGRARQEKKLDGEVGKRVNLDPLELSSEDTELLYGRVFLLWEARPTLFSVLLGGWSALALWLVPPLGWSCL
jgi:hypothetical protein